MDSSLVVQYRSQERWRRWDDALALLPLERGQRVFDFGCGIGQISARLQLIGAEVLGIDANEELLAEARTQNPNARFECMNMDDVTPQSIGQADGLWASFVTAYFPDLVPVLRRWAKCLRPGGWIALMEMDDLLGHEPFPPEFRGAVAQFYEQSRRAGRYDFEGGRKLAPALSAAGFDPIDEVVLPDDELSFCGAAPPDVLEAWRARLRRMEGLKTFLGGSFKAFEEAFTATLNSDQHRSLTRVSYVVARRRS